MPPKGGNAKKEAGRAKKAENEGKKKEAAAAEKERKESAVWDDGAPRGASKKAEAEERRKAELARKAENARLLATEEAALPTKPKAAPKAAKKGAAAAAPAGPGAIAAGGLAVTGVVEDEDEDATGKGKGKVESFTATGIEGALALLEVVNAKTDKAAVGAQAAGIERHPERRFKAAFEAYQERELPRAKQEYPGLRLAQYKDLLFKQFQKSPENPFNQTLVAYDASQEEKVDALRRKKEAVEDSFRDE
jgi:hypothetical protein